MKRFIAIIGLLVVLLLAFAINTPADQSSSTQFMFVRGPVTFNGLPAPPGTVIDAFDNDSVHCGTITTDSVGWYGYMSIDGDDPITDSIDEGPLGGEVVTFHVNGRLATVVPGDSIPATFQHMTFRVFELAATGSVAFSLADFEEVQVLLLPDTTARFTIGVINEGDGLDFYGITSSSGNGWTTIDMPSPAYAIPGDTADVYFDLFAPTFGPEFIDTVTFTIFSYLDPSNAIDNVYVIKRAAGGTVSFTAVSYPSDTTAMPGDSIEFQVSINNTGTGTDYYGVSGSSTAGWEITSEPYVAIPSPQTDVVTFKVIVPTVISSLTDTVNYSVFSWVDTTQHVDSFLVIQIPLGLTSSMTLVDPAGDSSGLPGETVRLMIGVLNDGSSVDLYTVIASSARGWGFSVADSTFNAPGATAYPWIDLDIPSDADRDVDTLNYTVRSLIDGSSQVQGTVIVTSNPDTIIVLTVVEPPTLSFSGAPGDTIRFTIGIRNDGNVDDIYGMSSVSILGWTILALDSIPNLRGDTARISIDILIPGSATNETDDLSNKIFSYVDTSVSISTNFQLFSIFVDIIESIAGLPDRFEVRQNYPNPFNPATTIPFALPGRSEVSFEIINLLGQLVESRNLGYLAAGLHHLLCAGACHFEGIYFYRLVSDFGVQGHKMVLIK